MLTERPLGPASSVLRAHTAYRTLRLISAGKYAEELADKSVACLVELVLEYM
ncbi:MAG: hypothetical protein QW154_06090 [Sulfolobales archaeon]